MKTLSEIKSLIQQKGYWSVNIRPQKYNDTLIPLSSKLFTEFLQPCRIRLRGWDYPVGIFNDEAHGNTTDGIQVSNFGYLPEIWKFTRSGNFYQLFGLREDHLYWYTEKSKTPIFSVLEILFSLSEIFLFAKKMFSHEEMFAQDAHIEIELKGLLNRKLINDNPGRAQFEYDKICKVEEKYTYIKDISRDELILNYDKYALEVFENMVRLFEWNDPPMDIVAQDQQKFLKGRI